MSKRPERTNEEVRVTDEKTGGSKGQKPSRMDLLPAPVLDEDSRVYGMGAIKYDDTNYLKGFNWRLSYGALLRHLNEWAMGNSYDEESGLHHLAHARWHAATLMLFEWHGLGTDDRIEPQLEAGTLHAGEKPAPKKEEEKQVIGYCVKERKKTPIKDCQVIKMKNGRPAYQGVCPDCGTAIFKIKPQ